MTTWRFCFNLARIPQTRIRTIPCFMTLRAPFGSGSTDKSGQRAHCLSSESVIAVVGNYESATSFKSEPQLCMHRRLRDLRRSRVAPYSLDWTRQRRKSCVKSPIRSSARIQDIHASDYVTIAKSHAMSLSQNDTERTVKSQSCSSSTSKFSNPCPMSGIKAR